MSYGRLPLDEQLAGLRAVLTRNLTLVEVLTRQGVGKVILVMAW